MKALVAIALLTGCASAVESTAGYHELKLTEDGTWCGEISSPGVNLEYSGSEATLTVHATTCTGVPVHGAGVVLFEADCSGGPPYPLRASVHFDESSLDGHVVIQSTSVTTYTCVYSARAE